MKWNALNEQELSEVAGGSSLAINVLIILGIGGLALPLFKVFFNYQKLRRSIAIL